MYNSSNFLSNKRETEDLIFDVDVDLILLNENASTDYRQATDVHMADPYVQATDQPESDASNAMSKLKVVIESEFDEENRLKALSKDCVKVEFRNQSIDKIDKFNSKSKIDGNKLRIEIDLESSSFNEVEREIDESLNYGCKFKCGTFLKQYSKVIQHEIEFHGVLQEFICLKCSCFKFQSNNMISMQKHIEKEHNFDRKLKFNEDFKNIYLHIKEPSNLILRGLATGIFSSTGFVNEFFEKHQNEKDGERLLLDLSNDATYSPAIEIFNDKKKEHEKEIEDITNFAIYDKEITNFIGFPKSRILTMVNKKEKISLGDFKRCKDIEYSSSHCINLKKGSNNYFIKFNRKTTKNCTLFVTNCLVRCLKQKKDNQIETFRISERNYILDLNDLGENLNYLKIANYLFLQAFVAFQDEIKRLSKLGRNINSDDLDQRDLGPFDLN